MKRIAIIALCLAATGCEDKPAASPQQGEAASGEVLAGSISDAMIPLGQLESQGPLAPRQAQALGGNIDAEQPEVTPMPGIDALGTGDTPVPDASPPQAPPTE
jgi:hypothetical protein